MWRRIVFRFPESGDYEDADATQRYAPDPAYEQANSQWLG